MFDFSFIMHIAYLGAMPLTRQPRMPSECMGNVLNDSGKTICLLK